MPLTMNARAVTALLLSLVLLAGCAASSSFARPSNMDAASWGDPPADYEERIRSHFDSFLKDGASARFRIQPPVRAYANQGLIHGGAVRWKGYLVRVDVNAKNSFGAYTGWKSYMVLLSLTGVWETIEGASHPLVHGLTGDL